ncbi:MAG: hypothetical protein H7Y88_03925 [Phycisphaerales bacterium]|nr:hypothetical protein [Phycisphaerales bacterium]
MHKRTCATRLAGSRCALAAAALFISCQATLGQVSYTTIPLLPGFDEVQVSGISGDGSTVVGQLFDHPVIPGGQTLRHALRWTRFGGTTDLGTLGDMNSSADGTSFDGSIIVGSSGPAGGPTRPVRWVSGVIEDLGLPTLPGFTVVAAGATTTSHDGSVVAGAAFAPGTVPYRHSAADGYQALATAGVVHDMSADGSIIVGDGSPVAGGGFRWSTDDGLQSLGPLPPTWQLSYPNAISADGTTIVGRLQRGFPIFDSRAFTWNEDNGYQMLEELTPGTQTFANDVSADGSVVVGRAFGGACVWIDGEGFLITDLLALAGIDLGGAMLTESRAVSDDGLTIAGMGFDAAGFGQAWVVTIPAPGTGALLLGVCVAVIRRRRV